MLALGSNLGNREENLRRALVLLEEKGLRILHRSSVRVTKPWGKTDQPDFLNQVIHVETTLSPHSLLELCLGIEAALGRVRREKWGPRIIDIDILYYDDRVISEPGLTLPHPHLHERLFVLEPLTEIAPDFIHPVLRKPNTVLLHRAKDADRAVK